METKSNQSMSGASHEMTEEEKREATRQRVAALRAKRKAATKKKKVSLIKLHEARKKKSGPQEESQDKKEPGPTKKDEISEILVEKSDNEGGESDEEVSAIPSEFPPKPPMYFGTLAQWAEECKKNKKNEEKTELNQAKRGLDLEKLSSYYEKRRDRMIKKYDEGEKSERIAKFSDKYQKKYDAFINENFIALRAKYGGDLMKVQLDPYKPPSKCREEAKEFRQNYFKSLLNKKKERSYNKPPESEESSISSDDYLFSDDDEEIIRERRQRIKQFNKKL